jgi:site-specific recombinase XerD
MATDFAISLRRFLTDHMAGLRGCSPNTISSYRDTFKLLICYLRDERQVPPERLSLEHIDATAITAFLAWLRAERHNSPSTCNQRLAAVSSFYRWLQTQDPARMACCQDILAIPSSKHGQPAIAHLTVEQTRLLLALPDRSTRQGRRDATLLATLYDSAARVQELADLTVRDVRLEGPAIVALTGKGRKTRHVPIDDNTTALLAAYLAERQLDRPGRDQHPVFFNQHHAKLSRGGIAWILHKYQAQSSRIWVRVFWRDKALTSRIALKRRKSLRIANPLAIASASPLGRHRAAQHSALWSSGFCPSVSPAEGGPLRRAATPNRP